MPVRTVTLQPPLAGLDRSQSLQGQPPYTTPKCLNVRPRDVYENRQRIGSRSGLCRAFNQELGDGYPVQMLSNLTILNNDLFTFWDDIFFEETLNEVWSQPSWLSNTPDLYPLDGSDLLYEDESGLIRAGMDGIDTSKAYSVSIFIPAYTDGFCGEFNIWSRLDDTTPLITQDGIEAKLVLTSDGDTEIAGNGYYAGELKDYSGGSLISTTAFSTGTFTDVLGGWFTLLIDGDDITIYWNGVQIASKTVSSHSGVGFGWGFKCTVPGGVCLVDAVQVKYYKLSGETPNRTILVAAANGKLYYENKYRQMVLSSTDVSLANDRELNAVEYEGQLYIADNGEPKVEKDSAVITNDVELTHGDIADWTALGIDPLTDCVVITNGQGGTIDGIFIINTVSVDKLILDAPGGNPFPGSGTCSISIQRAPKVYDPVTDTLSLWISTTGIMPIGCKLIELYRGRLTLVKDYLWYMSRQFDPLDFDYFPDDGVSDAQRAMAGYNADAGKIGKPITAIKSHNDAYLMMGSSHALYVLRGDPAQLGGLDPVSEVEGIVSSNAICRGADGETYFLSHNGLYMIPRGAEVLPANLSYSRLPNELRKLDTVNNDITIVYDPTRNGLHIYVTPIIATGKSFHWWYDKEYSSFWMDKYPDTHEPFCAVLRQSSSPFDFVIIAGCRDGYLREYRDSRRRDDQDTIESYVFIGPVRLGNNDYVEGIVTDMQATIQPWSSTVTWDLIVSEKYPEKAITGTPLHSGTFTPGFSGSQECRASGSYFSLKISGNGGWAMDNIVTTINTLGIKRI